MKREEAIKILNEIREIGKRTGTIYFPNVGYISLDVALESPEDFAKYLYDFGFRRTGKSIKASELLRYVRDWSEIELKSRIESGLGAKFYEISKDLERSHPVWRFAKSLGYGIQYSLFSVAPELLSPITLGLSNRVKFELQKYGIADEFESAYNFYIMNKASNRASDSVWGNVLVGDALAGKFIGDIADKFMEGWIGAKGVGGIVRSVGNIASFLVGFSKFSNLLNFLSSFKFAQPIAKVFGASGALKGGRLFLNEALKFSTYDMLVNTFDPYQTSMVDILHKVLTGEIVTPEEYKQGLYNLLMSIPASLIPVVAKYNDAIVSYIFKRVPNEKLIRYGLSSILSDLERGVLPSRIPTESEIFRGILTRQITLSPAIFLYELSGRALDISLNELFGLHAQLSFGLPDIYNSLIGAGMFTAFNLAVAGITGRKISAELLRYIQYRSELEKQMALMREREFVEEAKPEPERVILPEASPVQEEFAKTNEIIEQISKHKEEMIKNFQLKNLLDQFAFREIRFPFGGNISAIDENAVKGIAYGEILLTLVGQYNALNMYAKKLNRLGYLGVLDVLNKRIEHIARNIPNTRIIYSDKPLRETGRRMIKGVIVNGMNFRWEDIADDFKYLVETDEFFIPTLVKSIIIDSEEFYKQPIQDLYLTWKMGNLWGDIREFFDNPIKWYSARTGVEVKNVKKSANSIIVEFLKRLSDFDGLKIFADLNHLSGNLGNYDLKDELVIFKFNGNPYYVYLPKIINKTTGEEVFNPVKRLGMEKYLITAEDLQKLNFELPLDFPVIATREELKRWNEQYGAKFKEVLDISDLIRDSEVVNKMTEGKSKLGDNIIVKLDEKTEKEINKVVKTEEKEGESLLELFEGAEFVITEKKAQPEVVPPVSVPEVAPATVELPLKYKRVVDAVKSNLDKIHDYFVVGNVKKKNFENAKTKLRNSIPFFADIKDYNIKSVALEEVYKYAQEIQNKIKALDEAQRQRYEQGEIDRSSYLEKKMEIDTAMAYLNELMGLMEIAGKAIEVKKSLIQVEPEKNIEVEMIDYAKFMKSLETFKELGREYYLTAIERDKYASDTAEYNNLNVRLHRIRQNFINGGKDFLGWDNFRDYLKRAIGDENFYKFIKAWYTNLGLEEKSGLGYLVDFLYTGETSGHPLPEGHFFRQFLENEIYVEPKKIGKVKEAREVAEGIVVYEEKPKVEPLGEKEKLIDYVRRKVNEKIEKEYPEFNKEEIGKAIEDVINSLLKEREFNKFLQEVGKRKNTNVFVPYPEEVISKYSSVVYQTLKIFESISVENPQARRIRGATELYNTLRTGVNADDVVDYVYESVIKKLLARPMGVEVKNIEEYADNVIATEGDIVDVIDGVVQQVIDKGKFADYLRKIEDMLKGEFGDKENMEKYRKIALRNLGVSLYHKLRNSETFKSLNREFNNVYEKFKRNPDNFWNDLTEEEKRAFVFFVDLTAELLGLGISAEGKYLPELIREKIIDIFEHNKIDQEIQVPLMDLVNSVRNVSYLMLKSEYVTDENYKKISQKVQKMIVKEKESLTDKDFEKLGRWFFTRFKSFKGLEKFYTPLKFKKFINSILGITLLSYVGLGLFMNDDLYRLILKNLFDFEVSDEVR